MVYIFKMDSIETSIEIIIEFVVHKKQGRLDSEVL